MTEEKKGPALNLGSALNRDQSQEKPKEESETVTSPFGGTARKEETDRSKIEGDPAAKPADDATLIREIKHPLPSDPPRDPEAIADIAAGEHTNTPDTARAEQLSEAIGEVTPANRNQGTHDFNQPADQDSLLNRRDPNAKPQVGSDDFNPGVGGRVEDMMRPGDFQPPEEFDEGEVIFSSHPLQRFGIGRRYKFVNGQLKLSKKEAVVFRKVLGQQDMKTRRLVKEIDPEAAEAFIRARRPIATKSIDSVDPLSAKATEIGTKDIRE